MNQPGAGLANFHTLALSVAPLLGEGKKGLKASDKAVEQAAKKFQVRSWADKACLTQPDDADKAKRMAFVRSAHA